MTKNFPPSVIQKMKNGLGLLIDDEHKPLKIIRKEGGEILVNFEVSKSKRLDRQVRIANVQVPADTRVGVEYLDRAVAYAEVISRKVCVSNTPQGIKSLKTRKSPGKSQPIIINIKNRMTLNIRFEDGVEIKMEFEEVLSAITPPEGKVQAIYLKLSPTADARVGYENEIMPRTNMVFEAVYVWPEVWKNNSISPSSPA